MQGKELKKQVEAYAKHSCKYTWDELEELITNAFDEEKITSEEFDNLMERLMEIDALEDEVFEEDENW